MNINKVLISKYHINHIKNNIEHVIEINKSKKN